MAKYYVARSCAWDTGIEAVDISLGIDGLSADSLEKNPTVYGPDEFSSHADPRDVAAAAARIVKRWDEQTGDSHAIMVNGIAELTPAEEDAGFDAETIHEWAKREVAAMPHCDRCGEPLFNKKPIKLYYDDSWTFCSTQCAEEYDEHGTGADD